ncbi:MAG: wax ester/triacylglycerol synthase family O-acyltransferase [Sandaracinaceae bacterium]
MGHSERLSALDSAFLAIEEGGAHMHIGAIATLDARPLTTPEGGIDFERIYAHIERGLDLVPRYRQVLAEAPGLSQPQWVDDASFRLAYHVRHTALPRPGTLRQLRRLAGRVFSGRLDRARPLWELWVVEGLEGDRFALVLKAHHCLVDGMGGVGLLSMIFGPERAASPTAWTPRPAPTMAQRLAHEVEHRSSGAKVLEEMLVDVVRHPREALAAAGQGLGETATLVREAFTPCRRTILNPSMVGPHRRFHGLRFDLADVKRVKDGLGGKLNDVVLATAAGGIGRWLERRGEDVAALTDFRALVPVDVRHGKEGVGNRVGMMFAPLPLAETDPVRRFERVVEVTTRLKGEAGHARTTERVEDLSDWALPSFVTDLFKLAGWLNTFNVVITNVPGPPMRLSLCGATLRSVEPLVPLFRSQALGLALFSYDGGLFWGLNADWAIVDDLHVLADDLEHAFAELRAAV